jgi:hypothetical protein
MRATFIGLGNPSGDVPAKAGSRRFPVSGKLVKEL